mmetsp:Transcript_122505/g.183187  ORF Transcript_122505/g.183187 Transcript_122505/m.183187 type:complete len:222 (-) Transcript_122505:111-776(-)
MGSELRLLQLLLQRLLPLPRAPQLQFQLPRRRHRRQRPRKSSPTPTKKPNSRQNSVKNAWPSTRHGCKSSSRACRLPWIPCRLRRIPSPRHPVIGKSVPSTRMISSTFTALTTTTTTLTTTLTETRPTETRSSKSAPTMTRSAFPISLNLPSNVKKKFNAASKRSFSRFWNEPTRVEVVPPLQPKRNYYKRTAKTASRVVGLAVVVLRYPFNLRMNPWATR